MKTIEELWQESMALPDDDASRQAWLTSLSMAEREHYLAGLAKAVGMLNEWSQGVFAGISQAILPISKALMAVRDAYIQEQQ